jgi:hypothetical protein
MFLNGGKVGSYWLTEDGDGDVSYAHFRQKCYVKNPDISYGSICSTPYSVYRITQAGKFQFGRGYEERTFEISGEISL